MQLTLCPHDIRTGGQRLKALLPEIDALLDEVRPEGDAEPMLALCEEFCSRCLAAFVGLI